MVWKPTFDVIVSVGLVFPRVIKILVF